MKALRFILASTAAILAVACTQKELVEKNTEGTLVFTATFENNDVKSTITDGKWAWEEGDQVLVTDGTNKETVTLAAGDITENGAVAKIKTTTIPAGAAKYFAVTPPRKYKGIVDGTDIELSAASSYTSNEIKTVIAATTGSTFAFKNVFSLLKFDTKLAFDHATMTATNIGDDRALMHVCKFNPETGEYIWGDFATVNPTLSRGENESGPYYIEFVPHALPNGFTLTLYDENDAELAAFTRSEALTPVRGHIYNIANFDKRTGVEPIFYESFDKCDGDGGNDGNFAPSASDQIVPDLEGWTFVNGFAGDQCARFGSSSKLGSALTPALGITATVATLKFKGACYNNSKDLANPLIVSVEGAGYIPEEESTLKIIAEWQDYTVHIIGANASTKVKFSGRIASNNRYFLDEIKVFDSGEYNYMEISKTAEEISCEAQDVKFNVTANVAWTASCSNTNVTVSPASGSTDAEVTVSVPANETVEEVTYKVTVEGNGDSKEFVITQAANVAAIESKTIAEFITLADTNTNYQLTGVATDISGKNFNLTDATGTIYVYNIDSVPFVNGDIVTLYGPYKLYSSTHEVSGATYVSHVTTPKMSVSKTEINVAANATSASFDIVADSSVEWTVTSNNPAVSVSPASGSGNKTITLSFAANTTSNPVESTIVVSSSTENVYKAPLQISFTQAVAGGTTLGETWTYTFTNNPFTNNPATLDGLTWNVTIGTKRAGSGGSVAYSSGLLTLGSNSNRSDVDMSTASYKDGIKKVTLSLHANSKKYVDVAVKVGDTALGSSVHFGSASGALDDTATFESTEMLTGEIVISFTNPTGGFGITSITIN